MKKQFVVILIALFALGTATVSAVDGKKLTAYVSWRLCSIWYRAT